jgi:hypothetical protein
MMFDQRMDRGECHTRMANQVGQGRQADIYTFAHKSLGLAVQRLVLALTIALGPCMDGSCVARGLFSFDIWSAAAMYTASKMRRDSRAP